MTGTNAIKRRYLCLWLPTLSADRMRRAGALADGPAATVTRVGNTAYLTGLDAGAKAAGLRAGMTLASARAICPGLQAPAADPDADRAFLKELALWCDRFTPLAALDGADGLMLDIAGCAHLFEEPDTNGEDAMLRAALDGLTAQGVRAAGAVAATSGAAAALARYGGRTACRVAPEVRLSDVLGPLPVAALTAVDSAIGEDVLTGLDRVGLRRIADLTGLPRASLASRFGLALAGALDQALGTAPRPIDPRPVQRPYRVRLRFPDPIGDTADIEAALDRLLIRLCQRLKAEGRGCRRLDWHLFRADGSDQTLGIGTARPARDPARLAALFAEAMKTVEPGYGIDSMLLAAPVVEDFETAQDGMALSDGTAPAAKVDAGAVVDRLTNRLGAENVFRLAPVDSHLPDRAQTRVPAMPDGGVPPWPATDDRPLKLLEQPYPIDPLAAGTDLRAPDAFRIFGRRSRLRVLRGPERIAPEWWRADARWQAGPRDYFDVEDETGRRFWIYREPAAPKPRWYLHGLF